MEVRASRKYRRCERRTFCRMLSLRCMIVRRARNPAYFIHKEPPYRRKKVIGVGGEEQEEERTRRIMKWKRGRKPAGVLVTVLAGVTLGESYMAGCSEGLYISQGTNKRRSGGLLVRKRPLLV
jgi:hypothetical protein